MGFLEIVPLGYWRQLHHSVSADTGKKSGSLKMEICTSSGARDGSSTRHLHIIIIDDYLCYSSVHWEQIWDSVKPQLQHHHPFALKNDIGKMNKGSRRLKKLSGNRQESQQDAESQGSSLPAWIALWALSCMWFCGVCFGKRELRLPWGCSSVCF